MSASISSVITQGFGPPGDVYLVITDGFGTAAGAYVPPPPVIVSTGGGVRKARFLRRGPRLPWDEPEESDVVTVEEPPKRKRKRIKLPAEVIEVVQDAIPVQAYIEVPMPRIVIPDVPVSLDDEEDDDWLMMV